MRLATDYDRVRVSLVEAVCEGCELDEDHVITLEAEQPGAPRPSLPYVGLKIIIPGGRIGGDGVQVLRTDPDGSMLVSYSGSRRMTVSFHAFGASHEQAYGIMATWQAALQTDAVRDILGGANVAVWKPGDVRDLSALLTTGFEGRAQMDVTFGVLSQLTQRVTTIRAVDIRGNVETGDPQDADVALTVASGD